MNLALAPGVDISDAPKVALGGVEFVVPRLMARQLAKIEQRLVAALAYVNRCNAAIARIPRNADGNADPATPAEVVAAALADLVMTEAEWDVVLRVVHAGITRAHPFVTLDDLLDSPINSSDLRAALNVVIVQSQRLRPAGEAAQGEEGAASR